MRAIQDVREREAWATLLPLWWEELRLEWEEAGRARYTKLLGKREQLFTGSDGRLEGGVQAGKGAQSQAGACHLGACGPR